MGKLEPREAQVLRGVVQACLARGVPIRRQNTGAMMVEGRFVRFGKAGNSDLTGIVPGGRRLDVEVKRPGRRPTPQQIAYLQEVNRFGGVGLWTDDADVFGRWLDAILLGMRVRLEDDGEQFIEEPT